MSDDRKKRSPDYMFPTLLLLHHPPSKGGAVILCLKAICFLLYHQYATNDDGNDTMTNDEREQPRHISHYYSSSNSHVIRKEKRKGLLDFSNVLSPLPIRSHYTKASPPPPLLLLTKTNLKPNLPNPPSSSILLPTTPSLVWVYVLPLWPLLH